MNHLLDFIHCHLGMNLIQLMIFGFIFPIFYGLMLGDVGYGFVILLVSRWVIRRIEGKKRNLNIMPKFLRKFALTILQPVQMVKLAKAMILDTIVAIVLGFCFNLYFGFHLNRYLFSLSESILDCICLNMVHFLILSELLVFVNFCYLVVMLELVWFFWT